MRATNVLAAMAGGLLMIVAGCGPNYDSSQNYYLVVENHGDEPLVVTPLNDDVDAAFGDAFYMVPDDGAPYWAWGGVVYDRPAAVFVYDSRCTIRGKVLIPSNSPGRYLIKVDERWVIGLSRIDEQSTPPPAAPDNSTPCESRPSARAHVTFADAE